MPDYQTDALEQQSATALLNLMRKKLVSPVELTRAYLDVIERFNPKVNAICTLAAEAALLAARDAETAIMRDETTGSLHGLPIGIKDVTPTAGIRTTYGSPLYADHIPDEDAAVVSRLKEAGAIIIGKTNTPEFAAGANTVNELFGVTRNPWDLRATVGGSTGGGAAAVASGMMPLAEGTDFGGSLRVPAAFCGVVGLRPTVGLVPNYPVPLPWDTGRTHGPIARTAEDAAIALEAMVGLSDTSPISVMPPWRNLADSVRMRRDAKGLRLGFVGDLADIGVEPEIVECCRGAAMSLLDAGASVEEIEFDVSYGRDAYRVLRGEWMVGQYFAHLSAIDKLGPNLGNNIRAGLKLSATDVAEAEATRTSLWLKWRKLFARFDILLTPTVPIPPFPAEQNFPDTIAGKKLQTYIDWIAPTFLVTLCSLPACSVPCGKTKNGMPIGLQIIGARFDEPRILGIAKLVQEGNPIGWPPLVDRHA